MKASMVHGWTKRAPSLFIIVKVSSKVAEIDWTIPHGPTEIAEHIARRHPSWSTHNRSPAAWNLRQYCFIFYTIQTSICCIDCLVIPNICTYISLCIRNMAISVNKKLVCISPHQLVNTCDLHLALYIAIPRGSKLEISPVEDIVSTTTTSKHQRFTLNIHSFKIRKRS